MDRKWVPFWRKSIDSAVFKNDQLWRLWSWCLLRAAHEDIIVPMKTGRGETLVNLKRGQLIAGRKTGAEIFGWPESSFRNRLAKLKKLGNVEVKPDTHWSIVTIVNWDSYQLKENNVDTQVDTQRTGKGQAKDTYKNLRTKELKKESKPSGRFTPPTLEEVIAYHQEKEYIFDPQQFFDYYSPPDVDWKNGKGKKMKSWRQTMTTWNSRERKKNPPPEIDPDVAKANALWDNA